MTAANTQDIKSILEALLFISEHPITIVQMKDVLEGVSVDNIKTILQGLQEDYAHQNRGMVIVEIADGYQMLSNSFYAPYVRNFFKTRHKEKLSKPALECLAIIAYRQPVSRTDIELIRGVNSDGVVIHLLEKGLIKITGRKEIPGRPYLYGTTKQFLEYFGLKSLSGLPKLEDFPSLQPTEGGESKSPESDLPSQSEEVKELARVVATPGESPQNEVNPVNENPWQQTDLAISEPSGQDVQPSQEPAPTSSTLQESIKNESQELSTTD